MGCHNSSTKVEVIQGEQNDKAAAAPALKGKKLPAEGALEKGEKCLSFSERVSIQTFKIGAKIGSGHKSEKKKSEKLPSMPGAVSTDVPPPAQGTLLGTGEASAKPMPPSSPIQYIL